MAIFKCKMCGGTLDVAENMTVCQCEYCGAKQTLPRSGSDITNNLFNRANNLRMKCEYDKAQEIYEKIVSSGADDAEAYWGLVLCKYGIEYVEDPATFNKIPTCHRTQLESVLTDIDYQAALDHADSARKELYMAEAKEIDRLQKNILDIVHTEKPFDVFICYKESDENGRRTQDSVIANEIYHQLTQEGFKVFYAAITLEDKLGQAYEPYIFAALNSARIMLAIGTKPEYFNAVWVKNEWSRYLKIIKNDRKKLLIPCYKDMDAYDLPEEFSHLQAQDMSKIGFMNDVIRGIRKVLNTEEKPAAVVRETVVTSGGGNIAPLLKRAFLFLEDGDWANANAYCEKVLDIDPECAQAYFGKFLAELRLHREEDLLNIKTEISATDNYRKAYRFGDNAFKKKIENYYNQVIYDKATAAMQNAQSYSEYQAVSKQFDSISGYKDSAEKAKECLEKAEFAQKNDTYNQAERHRINNNVEEIKQAILLYKSISGFEDADEKVIQCETRISEIEEENKRQDELARIEEARIEKINKIIGICLTIIAVALIAYVFVLNM